MYARVLVSGQTRSKSSSSLRLDHDRGYLIIPTARATRGRSRCHVGHWPSRGHGAGQGRGRCDRPRQSVGAGGGRPGKRPAVARGALQVLMADLADRAAGNLAGGTGLGRLERPGCLAPDRRGRYLDRPERPALVRCQARSPLVGRRGGDDSALPRGRPQNERLRDMARS